MRSRPQSEPPPSIMRAQVLASPSKQSLRKVPILDYYFCLPGGTAPTAREAVCKVSISSLYMLYCHCHSPRKGPGPKPPCSCPASQWVGELAGKALWKEVRRRVGGALRLARRGGAQRDVPCGLYADGNRVLYRRQLPEYKPARCATPASWPQVAHGVFGCSCVLGAPVPQYGPPTWLLLSTSNWLLFFRYQV
jgi:hypothetical protein